jgi:hypothetical protein
MFYTWNIKTISNLYGYWVLRESFLYKSQVYYARSHRGCGTSITKPIFEIRSEALSILPRAEIGECDILATSCIVVHALHLIDLGCRGLGGGVFAALGMRES